MFAAVSALGVSRAGLSLRDSLRIPTRGGGLRFFNFFNGGTNTVHTVLCTCCTYCTVQAVQLYIMLFICGGRFASSMGGQQTVHTVHCAVLSVGVVGTWGFFKKYRNRFVLIQCEIFGATCHHMQGCTPDPLQEGAVEEHYAIVVQMQ